MDSNKKREAQDVVERQITDSLKVRVNFFNYPKMDLGGFRSAKTSIDYYNYFTQADQPIRNHPSRFNRSTQTVETNTRSTHPKREFGTQMECKGILIDTRGDKVGYPGKYFDSDMWLRRRQSAALFIQKMYRGYLGRKYMETIRVLRQDIDKEKNRLTVEHAEKEEREQLEEIARRSNPKVDLSE